MVLVVCLVLWMVLALVAWVARREQGDLLQRMSIYLYKLGCIYKLPLMDRQQVSKDLERLNPGMCGRELQADYYAQKIRLVILVLLVGSVLAGMLSLKVMLASGLGQDPRLERSAVGEGEQEVHLIAEIGDEREEVYVNVLERQLKEDELKILFEECLGELEELIVKAADEMGKVRQDLELPDAMDDYPFEIVWKSSDPVLIGTDGSLKQEQYTGEELVWLTVTLWYGERSIERDFLVEPAAMTQETALGRSLQEAIRQEDVDSRYEEVLPLPKQLGTEKVTWTLVQEDNAPVFLVLTLVTAAGVFLLKDKDLHEQTLERKRNLKMAYPMILNKFVLYMGAGMTVRGSFLKIAADYQKSGGKEQAAYEEMLYSCHELSAGVSEGMVYERFGKRSGLQEYARFAAMLGQNLKKGNSALLGRLREESDKAMQEDLQFRKKIGEEAETKLLVPMIMMLGMVMLLVMIPAFSTFG